MSIDETVLELRWLKKVNQEILETDAKELDVDSAWIKHWENVDKSLDMAIETMRKYQQIEQIYQQWNEVNDFSYNQAMQKIGEVVEDGNGVSKVRI